MVGLNGMKSSLGKSLSYPLSHCKATLWDLFGKVLWFGYELDKEPLHILLYWNTLWEQRLAPSEYAWEVSLNKMTLENKETLDIPKPCTYIGCVLVLPLASGTPSIRVGLWLRISWLANMVYVDYCIFSSCGIHASVGEVLWSLGSEMRHYLDIAQLGFEDVSVWVPRYSPRPLCEYPWSVECLSNGLMNIMN